MIDLARRLPLAVNDVVDLATRLILIRATRRSVRSLVLRYFTACHRGQALAAVGDLVDATLVVQLLEGGWDLATCELLDHGLKRGIPLPDDVV